mgnify:CR=1 FL=1
MRRGSWLQSTYGSYSSCILHLQPHPFPYVFHSKSRNSSRRAHEAPQAGWTSALSRNATYTQTTQTKLDQFGRLVVGESEWQACRTASASDTFIAISFFSFLIFIKYSESRARFIYFSCTRVGSTRQEPPLSVFIFAQTSERITF